MFCGNLDSAIPINTMILNTRMFWIILQSHGQVVTGIVADFSDANFYNASFSNVYFSNASSF